MKKLLSLLSVLTISGSAIPTTIAASPYQKQEKLNNDINYLQTNNLKQLNRIKKSADNLNNQPTVINLNQLKVNNSNIDLNHLYNKNPAATKDDIKEAILIEIASSNNIIINDIVSSLLTEKNKWIISGIIFKVPNSGQSLEYNAKFFPLDRSKYTGVLSAKVTVSNLNNIKDLNDVITNKNLNTIVNSDNNEILKVLKEKNSDLDISEIDIDTQNLTYKDANIKAKKNSSKYFGSVIINFNVSKITLKAVGWDSEYISLSSYSGPETKTSEKEYRYNASLGKEMFLNNFKKIKIKFSGDSITSRPQWEKKFFRSEIKLFDISSDYNKQFFWNDYQQWYGNYDSSAGWLETYWSGNEFILKAVAYIKVDSSPISTDHSRSKAQLKIEEISFE